MKPVELEDFAASQCEGKHKYPSAAAANKVARAQSKKKRSRIEAYKCPTCGAFHVGQRPRKAGRRPVERSTVPRRYQEQPTPERLEKGVWLVDQKEARRDVATAPIDRLEHSGTIDNDQASAGRQFEQLWRAQNEIHGIRDSCTIWEPKGFASDDGPIEAAERWRKLCRHLGMLREAQLRWVCVDHNDPRPRDIGALREALNEAIRFFKS